MEKKYLDQLPVATKSLVEEIENFSGREILVLTNPYPINSNDPNPDGLACEISENSASIFFRNNILDLQAFTHELLHIHRYWVRKIPQVLPVNDSTGSNIKVTSSIENTIEHLIIVPEEEHYGFEPHAHWNTTCRANWDKFEPQKMDNFAIKMNCLLGWLTITHLVTDDDVARKAENIIKKQGYLQKAKQMSFKVRSYRDSKEKQISCVVKFLGIPRSDVKLVYFEPNSGQRTEREIEKYQY